MRPAERQARLTAMPTTTALARAKGTKGCRGQGLFSQKLLQAQAGTFLYAKRNVLTEQHSRYVNSEKVLGREGVLVAAHVLLLSPFMLKQGAEGKCPHDHTL